MADQAYPQLKFISAGTAILAGYNYYYLATCICALFLLIMHVSVLYNN